jgi:hypothetical protein
LRGYSPNSDGSNCDNKLHYTDDDGATWFGGFGGSGAYGPGYSMYASADDDRVYLGYGAGQLVAFDVTGPTSATYFDTGGPTYPVFGSYVSNTKDHAVVSFWFNNYGVYVSENGGATMTSAGIGHASAGHTYDPGTPQNWWMASGGSIGYSTDNGYTWSTQTTGFPGALSLAVR